MEIKQFMNDIIPDVTDQLESSIKDDYHVNSGEELGISGRDGVYEVLDGFLTILFPGCFSRDKISPDEINFLY